MEYKKIMEQKDKAFKTYNRLRYLASNETKDFDKSIELRKQEDEYYKKYLFYKNMLKQINK